MDAAIASPSPAPTAAIPGISGPRPRSGGCHRPGTKPTGTTATTAETGRPPGPTGETATPEDTQPEDTSPPTEPDPTDDPDGNDDVDAGDPKKEGCGCQSPAPSAGWLLLLAPLLRRRCALAAVAFLAAVLVGAPEASAQALDFDGLPEVPVNAPLQLSGFDEVELGVVTVAGGQRLQLAFTGGGINGFTLTNRHGRTVADQDDDALQPGTYDLVVGDAAFMGAYDLTWSIARAPVPLALGPPVSDTLAVGDVRAFTYTASLGEQVELTGVPVDVRVLLTDPLGTPVADTMGGLLLAWNLGAGDHRIELVHESTADAPYTVTCPPPSSRPRASSSMTSDPSPQVYPSMTAWRPPASAVRPSSSSPPRSPTPSTSRPRPGPSATPTARPAPSAAKCTSTQAPGPSRSSRPRSHPPGNTGARSADQR